MLDTASLPSGLTDLYHKFLNREVGKDDNRWEKLLKPILGLVAVAQDEGLTLEQLNTFSGRDSSSTLRELKQYFAGALPHGPFRIFHDSFRGFLFDDAEAKFVGDFVAAWGKVMHLDRFDLA